MDIKTLRQQAREVAKTHGITRQGSIRISVFPSMKKCNNILIQSYRSINEDIRLGSNVVPAAEWFVDNFYMIEEHMKEIRYNLSRRYLKTLPILMEEGLQGVIRVYAVARAIVDLTDGGLDRDSIYAFLAAYQEETLLTMAELWAIPMMIKIVLIDIIKDKALAIVNIQNMQKEAEDWAHRLLETYNISQSQLDKLLDEHDNMFNPIQTAYVERLLRALRDNGVDGAAIIKRIDEKLVNYETDAEAVIRQEYRNQTEAKVSIGNVITSLKFVSGLKGKDIFEELSEVEKILREDPAHTYSKMEFASRDYYRKVVEKLSKRNRCSEVEVAKMALRLSYEEGNLYEDARYSHVGYYLIGKGRRRLEQELNIGTRKITENANLYMGGIICLIVVMIGAFLYLTGVSVSNFSFILLYALLAVVPIGTIVIGVCNWIITRIYPPTMLPRLEFEGEIPEEFRTMVVIPTLLTNVAGVKDLVEQMEVFYLANRDKRLHFALVGDYKDGSKEHELSDDSIVNTAIELINELNNKYDSDIFFYFHRYRQFNTSQNLWMGWERKRGALVEFNRLLRGAEDTSYYIQKGNLSILPKIKYVITLDADTCLPRDMAKKLIGTLAHPLNRAILNDESTLVTEGYGIIQPRISVSIESATRSFFALKFSGQVGIDPYTTAVSDIYQDLFGEGIFTGKGIYDVDVFNHILYTAIPENTVLSHDLLEGAYIRAGLATDIELIDGYPSHYMAYAMRQHRWARGDWQLIPWLGGKVKNSGGEIIANPLSPVSKWKIADNMRRSLISPILLLISILASLNLLVGSKSWIMLAFATIIYPFVLDILGFFIEYYRKWRKYMGFGEIIRELSSTIWQTVLAIVFMAYQGYLMLDAIVRTLVRVCFTHKNMLEWTTAADTERKFTGSLCDFRSKMLPSIIIGVGQIIATLSIPQSFIVLGLSLGLIWIFAPWIAYLISRARVSRVPKLRAADLKTIRIIARRIWKYFEDFVTEGDNWLPPDNYQYDPSMGLAHRTSPTNIGLMLISNIAAQDLGYIGILELIERTEATVYTLNNMEKWNGHIYNWYDTKTLRPLKPLYVSTVDSGNLAGYLVVLLEGLDKVSSVPIVDKTVITGISDTIFVYLGREKEQLSNLLPPNILDRDFTLTRWYRILEEIRGMEIPELAIPLKSYCRELDELLPWVKVLVEIPDFLIEGKGLYKDIHEELLRVLNLLNRPISMYEYIKSYPETMEYLSNIRLRMEFEPHGDKNYNRAVEWFEDLERTLELSHENIEKLLSRIDELKGEIEDLFDAIDFGVLYDHRRELFSIGYDIEEGILSDSYYDLLASEARQASFIAIAKGDVPQKHWLRLGRALTLIKDKRVLLSWSGTMFEYLMPLLIMKNYDYTLLDETYMGAMKGQRQYGQRRRVPWGISESAYHAFDRHMNYQYKAFGVPKLGLKRGLVDDLVISPYSSILALQIEPHEAMTNINRLIDQGLQGEYGLYESIDYTPSRVPRGKNSVIIKSFMAHHQGMSLIAIDNLLNGNIMQERFHNQPIVKATQLILQERIPAREVYLKDFIEPMSSIYRIGKTKGDAVRRFKGINTYIPEVQILSNGSFSTMVTNSGSGFIKYGDAAISRWRRDAVAEDWGMYIYIQNLNSNNFWSATYMPCGIRPERYDVVFDEDRAVFTRRDGNIETRTDIVVSPTYNMEVRRTTLTNRSIHRRVLDITSYFELAISSSISDIAHRTFNNLFVITEFIPEYNALIGYRRWGGDLSKKIWVMHTLVLESGDDIGTIQYETNRLKFIGRGRDISSPTAMEPGTPLSNTIGAVLDPIMSLRKRVGIDGGKTATVSFITGVGETRDEVIALLEEHGTHQEIESIFELAWTHSQIELRYLNLSVEDANLYQKLASHVIYFSPNRIYNRDMIEANTKGRSALWAQGVSGDIPIVVVIISSVYELDILEQLLSAHEYWGIKGLKVDLVILNEFGSSYEQPVEERIRDLISISHIRDLIDKPGGVFVRQTDHMKEEDINTFIAMASLVIRGDSGSLEGQIRTRTQYILPRAARRISSPRYTYVHPPLFPKDELTFYNGIGGFWQNGEEYIIQLKSGEYTPMPWSNIIANEDFGTLVTEQGSCYTWYKNSRENKLTRWSNDPIIDPPGEVIYLRDDETGDAWTITPSPIRNGEDYVVRHGQGYTIFEHNSHGLYGIQTIYVPREDPVKVNLLTLYNPSPDSREISIYYYAEWVLGVDRYTGSQLIKSQYDVDLDVLIAENPFNEEFVGEKVFLASSRDIYSYTADRREFIGKNGRLKAPAALERERLTDTAGAGFDQCGAIHIKLTIPGDSRENIALIMGEVADMDKMTYLLQKYRRLESIDMELKRAKEFWRRTLETIQVSTPDESFNLLLNRWILYQTLVCRLWARTAFYQAGGAFGFRDQLQDTMAIIYSHPQIARLQILEHAKHQFTQGDVQHWWHPPNRGVRTRITDDLLFLPFITADYITITGDMGILDEQLEYLEDAELDIDEKDRYNSPPLSEKRESLYEHCIRAIERAARFGRHGLPLIGGGDWNDGMDKVGQEGEGESVWLGWFMYKVLKDFIPICESRADYERVHALEGITDKLLESIEESGWDGGWYRRAYFDDGTPLGSEHNDECQIDSISQSWAIISGGGKTERIREAMRSLENYLIDREAGLIKLLTPPFHNTHLDPGYIKGYVPGVRENGGQYTHAATWVILAYAILGDGDRAMELYNMINPINHTRTWIELFKYKVEPYVMAADVYSSAPYVGRGGWTWYTGTAAWMYRVGLEWLLGFKKEGNILRIAPSIPSDWEEYTIHYTYGRTLYSIRVKNGRGKVSDSPSPINLIDDGEHHHIEIKV